MCGLVADRDPFLLSLLLTRGLMQDVVELAFGLEGEQAFEFMGLFTWLTGSGMGWYADDCRGRAGRFPPSYFSTTRPAVARRGTSPEGASVSEGSACSPSAGA